MNTTSRRQLAGTWRAVITAQSPAPAAAAGKAVTGAPVDLPLTRITGLNFPDGRIDIDHDLIPPIINYQASSLMCARLSWINDLIRMRAGTLAERLTSSDNHGHEAAEVSDYLLLQILNRF